jgi:aminoglycoside phosphotransferase (APT) family kinase protein
MVHRRGYSNIDGPSTWLAAGRAGGGDLLRDGAARARDPDKNAAVEAAAMTAARLADVPVAEIYDYRDGALGQAYLLMERLDGETIPRRLLRDEAYAAVRPGPARRLREVLARIHQVDPGSVPGLARVDALGQVTGLYRAFAEPRPALEIGLRWLAAHQPAPAADTLVHGDFRAGNLMIGEDGLHGYSTGNWLIAVTRGKTWAGCAPRRGGSARRVPSAGSVRAPT